MGNNSGPFDRKVELLDKIADLLTGTDDLENPTGNRVNDALERIADAIENGDLNIGGGGSDGGEEETPAAPASYADMEDAPVKVQETVIETDTTAPSFTFGGLTYYRLIDHMLSKEELLGALVNDTELLTDERINDMSYTTSNVFGVYVPLIVVWFDRTPVDGENPYMPIISIGGEIAAANITPGVWVTDDVEKIRFRNVAVTEGYDNLLLPQYEQTSFEGQAMQMNSRGEWKAGAVIPIQGMSVWREVKRNVKLGRGATLYPVHTIFNVRSKKFGSIPFEVVAHDVDPDPDDANAHTMTLHCLEGLMRNGVYGYAFDATEKTCVCSSGLAAGKYNVSTNGDTKTFILTQAVPANGYLVIDFDNRAWELKAMKSYASNGTLLESVHFEDETDVAATELSSVIAAADMNDTLRAIYGSGNYGQSNIRQWLNGRGRNWYVAQTKFDMPPEYVNDEGFLDDLDSDFIDILLETEQTVTTNTVFEIGDGMSTSSTYTVADKIFLPSYNQIFGTAGDDTEGAQWTGYDATGLSSEEELLSHIKYEHSHKGEFPCWWWLRSPGAFGTSHARDVIRDGCSGGDRAILPWGAAAPACVI